MGFFNKEQPPEMPPLVEAPKGEEPIIFDEEEQQAIDKEVQRRLETVSQGKVFPSEVSEALSKGFATDALRSVVQRRMNRSDLKGAAATGMKVLGMALEIMPSDWLILAKIFALYGDSRRAKNFISAADNTRKKLRLDKMDSYSNEGWKLQVQEVKSIIDST